MTEPQLEIRLEPHVGKQGTPFGEVDVELGQWRVFAQAEDFRWLHMGYICQPCAANPRPPFNGLDAFRTLPQSLKDAIVETVSQRLGLSKIRVTEPPEPVVIPEEGDIVDDDFDA